MKRLLKKLKRKSAKPITRKKSRVYKKSASKKHLRIKPQKRKKISRKKSKKRKVKLHKPIIISDNTSSNTSSNTSNNNTNNNMVLVKERKPIRVCRIMNDHGEIIELPLEYPGDDVVHQDLNPLRHLEITQFDSQYFRDLYNKYRKVCSK